MGVCNCSIFCCTLLNVHSIILMGKRELVALLNLSSWCLVMVERLFLAVPRGCLQFVIVVFPEHTHLLFLNKKLKKKATIKHRYSSTTSNTIKGSDKTKGNIKHNGVKRLALSQQMTTRQQGTDLILKTNAKHKQKGPKKEAPNIDPLNI